MNCQWIVSDLYFHCLSIWILFFYCECCGRFFVINYLRTWTASSPEYESMVTLPTTNVYKTLKCHQHNLIFTDLKKIWTITSIIGWKNITVVSAYTYVHMHVTTLSQSECLISRSLWAETQSGTYIIDPHCALYCKNHFLSRNHVALSLFNSA